MNILNHFKTEYMPKKIIYSLLLSMVLYGCYTSKPLSREVKVFINANYSIQIEKDPKGHFVDYYTKEQYKQFFYEALIKQLNYNKISVDAGNPEYIIDIENVIIVEKLTTDTVKDAQSKDKGKVYDITIAEVKSVGKIRKTDNSQNDSWSAEKSKREKLTNLQTAGQVVTGQNSGAHDWRKKAFDSNEYLELTSSLGNRTGDVISKRLSRWIK